MIIPLFTFGSIYSTNTSWAEQMPETNNSNIIKHNRVKNPNWPEADQLAIYKHGPGFELGTTTNKSSQRSGRDLNSGPRNDKSSALTTRPSCRGHDDHLSRTKMTTHYNRRLQDITTISCSK